MELAALIKGANSPSQTYSRRSQLTIHQRFPREYSTSHCQFTPKVQWQWWLTFIEYLLCTRLCLAKLMRLTSLWCSVSEPQPNTQLTPKPMILSTRVLLREMCLLSYHLNHPPCPPALSSLTWRPRTKPGNQSLFTEGVGLPRISFALFPQLQAVFLLWEMPGNLTLQILAEKLPCPDQPNPKPQLLFHRCPQSGGACPAPPLQQNQLGMAAQIGDIYYTAPSTPPMSFLWPVITWQSYSKRKVSQSDVYVPLLANGCNHSGFSSSFAGWPESSKFSKYGLPTSSSNITCEPVTLSNYWAPMQTYWIKNWS